MLRKHYENWPLLRLKSPRLYECLRTISMRRPTNWCAARAHRAKIRQSQPGWTRTDAETSAKAPLLCRQQVADPAQRQRIAGNAEAGHNAVADGGRLRSWAPPDRVRDVDLEGRKLAAEHQLSSAFEQIRTSREVTPA